MITNISFPTDKKISIPKYLRTKGKLWDISKKVIIFKKIIKTTATLWCIINEPSLHTLSFHSKSIFALEARVYSSSILRRQLKLYAK